MIFKVESCKQGEYHAAKEISHEEDSAYASQNLDESKLRQHMYLALFARNFEGNLEAASVVLSELTLEWALNQWLVG